MNKLFFVGFLQDFCLSTFKILQKSYKKKFIHIEILALYCICVIQVSFLWFFSFESEYYFKPEWRSFNSDFTMPDLRSFCDETIVVLKNALSRVPFSGCPFVENGYVLCSPVLISTWFDQFEVRSKSCDHIFLNGTISRYNQLNEDIDMHHVFLELFY